MGGPSSAPSPPLLGPLLSGPRNEKAATGAALLHSKLLDRQSGADMRQGPLMPISDRPTAAISGHGVFMTFLYRQPARPLDFIWRQTDLFRVHCRRDMELMFHAARAPMKLGYTRPFYQCRDLALAGLPFGQRVVAKVPVRS